MHDRDVDGPASRTSGDSNSRLSAAILRINQSLDLTTVLNEVVERSSGHGPNSRRWKGSGRSSWAW